MGSRQRRLSLRSCAACSHWGPESTRLPFSSSRKLILDFPIHQALELGLRCGTATGSEERAPTSSGWEGLRSVITSESVITSLIAGFRRMSGDEPGCKVTAFCCFLEVEVRQRWIAEPPCISSALEAHRNLRNHRDLAKPCPRFSSTPVPYPPGHGTPALPSTR